MLDYDITIGGGGGYHKDMQRRRNMQLLSGCHDRRRTEDTKHRPFVVDFLSWSSLLTTNLCISPFFHFSAYPPQARHHGTLRSSSLQSDAKYFANALRQ